jgi:hypothetical protein
MPRIRKSESGQMVPLVAGALFVIMGLAAMVVDLGFLYATRRNMQTAADAAAVAGANALGQACGTNAGCNCDSQASCAAAGADVATLNGYTSGSLPNASTTVTVGNPRTPPPNPINGIFVQASVSEAVPTFFMRAVGFPTVNVGATAIAGYSPTPLCMEALCGGSQTINLSGSASINAPNCAIEDESSNSDGLNLSGGATLTAGSIGLVSNTWTGNGGGGVTPTPQYPVAAVPDPLSSLVPPAPCSSSGGCTGAPCNSLTTSGHGYSVSSTPSGPINPGVYCGGIAVSGNNTVLTLNPGTYILVGQNGNLVSSGSMVGNGVTFYDTYSSTASYNGIQLSGSSSTNLSAPSPGASVGVPGVLFWQDKTAPNASSQTSHISGSAGAVLQGDLYFPTSELDFSGGSSTDPEGATIIACTINVSGNAFLGTPAATGGEPPITTSRLYQ